MSAIIQAEPRLRDRVSLLLVLALLAWSPVPFGGNRPWAEALMGLLVFGLLALIQIVGIWSPREQRMRLEFARPIAGLFLAWVCWIALQIAPLPVPIVQGLSERAFGLYSAVADAGQWLSLSLDRDATLAMGLRVLTAAALVALLFLSLSSRRRLLTFSLVLVGCGVTQALLGLGVYWGGAVDAGAHLANPDAIGPVGTFVNRNHFAGFMEMALAMNTALILVYYKGQRSGSGWRAWLRDGSGQLLSMHGLLLAAEVVMFAALLLSGSRGGVLALLIAAAVLAGVLLLRRRSVNLAAGLPVAVAAAGALLWFGGGAFVTRLGALGLSSNRLDLAEVSLRIISDYPITGSGAGTFRWIFPLYKDARFGSLFYEHAHNDYLEIAVEQGLVGLLIFLALTGLLLYRAWRAWRDRRDPLARAVAVGALLAGLSMLVHSMIDFNLQIPANFYWFFAVLAAGACAGQVERGGRIRHEQTY